MKKQKKKIIFIIIVTLWLSITMVYILLQTNVIKIDTDIVNPYIPITPIAREEIKWNFSQIVESDGYNPPQSEAKIKVKEKEYTVGKYEGSCSEMNTNLLINQISGAVCWWAGGGTEFGIFIEDKKLLLKSKLVEEGSEYYPEFQDEFKTILEL